MTPLCCKEIRSARNHCVYLHNFNTYMDLHCFSGRRTECIGGVLVLVEVAEVVIVVVAAEPSANWPSTTQLPHLLNTNVFLIASSVIKMSQDLGRG